MNTTLSKTTNQHSPASINPFARALAEAKAGEQNSNFAQDTTTANPNTLSPEQIMEQQRQQAEKAKLERLRLELHRQVNPVEATDIYSAEKIQVKKEIESIRKEIKLLINDIAEFSATTEVEMSVMANVPDPGLGKYYLAFFRKLREWIQLLRQQVHSAQTWATSMTNKKKKRRMGMEIGGQQYEQTATIFDRAHHERSTQYSGS